MSVESLRLETQLAEGLETVVGRDLGSVPEVRYVLTERVPDSLTVWIAVDNPEEAVRRRTYATELNLISAFPEVAFDFNLVSVLGRSPSQIATGAHLAYSRT